LGYVTLPLYLGHASGRPLPWLLLACLLVPTAARGQDADAPRLNLTLRDVRFDLPAGSQAQPALGRPDCSGCPARNLWLPYVESLALNVLYNGLNHARGHETANVSPKTWLANLQAGFEWDHNAFMTNQFGHPYQGSNYFTSGRAHGLSYWESAAVAAFGSGTWEYFYENNYASFNDLINTTVGGAALGEVMYRLAWALRDPTGKGKNQWAALAIDPMNGLARATSHDADRITSKPADVAGRTFTWRATSGVVFQGPTSVELLSTTSAFFDIDVQYGDVRTGRSTTPFEAFSTQIAVGGGPFTQATIRGRLFGKPVGQRRQGQITIFQIFDFMTNPAYAFGGQGFELEVGRRYDLGRGTSLWLAATGGVSILAAVNSLLQPPDGVTIPDAIDKRTYDYGPGARFGGVVELQRGNLMRMSLTYQGFQVNVVDGRHAIHILQRVGAEVRVPVRRSLAIGAAAEYFYREAYFWRAGSRSDQSPQFRLFMAWSKGL